MDDNKHSRILIFGKNGQVGYELCRTLSTLGELHAVDIDECDLTDKASITGTLDRFRPTVIATPLHILRWTRQRVNANSL